MPLRTRSLVAALALAVALGLVVAAIAAGSRSLRARERAGDVRRGGAVIAADLGAALRVEVSAGAARAAFRRGPGGAWVAEGPGRPAQAEAVPALLGALEGLRRRGTSGAGHARTELGAYGLERPRARIAVALPAGALELAVGLGTGADGVTFLSADGAVTIVAASDGEALVRAVEAALGAPIAGGAAGTDLPLPPPVGGASTGG